MRERLKSEIAAAYSAAFCRGLIEAQDGVYTLRRGFRYSAAFCRGLIEAHLDGVPWDDPAVVFRGVLPRPH